MPDNQGMIMGMWKDLHAVLQRMSEQSGYDEPMPLGAEEELLANMAPEAPMPMEASPLAGLPGASPGVSAPLGPEEQAILAALQQQGPGAGLMV